VVSHTIIYGEFKALVHKEADGLSLDTIPCRRWLESIHKGWQKQAHNDSGESFHQRPGFKSFTEGAVRLTVEIVPVRITHVRMPFPPTSCKAALIFILLSCVTRIVHAEWQRDGTSLAWRSGTHIVWRFSYDAKKGKPFFHPVGLAGAPALTNFQPEDHPWHYGLWFSWKYINHVNYWEEDRQTGKAEGATRWTAPEIETHPDGSALIGMDLTYLNPSNRVDMTERRELEISAPQSHGGYAIDWRAHFTAGKEGAVLDRTPMPGEPDGRVNGGYAGLSLRMAGSPLAIAFVCSTGLVTQFESDRARPAASAVGCNFTSGADAAGSVAILSDAINGGENAPWYLINSEQMRFACAAILAPKPRTLQPGERLNLHYRIVVRREPWTPESLAAAARSTTNEK
jgi:Family of unknown function (DUF6807)